MQNCQGEVGRGTWILRDDHRQITVRSGSSERQGFGMVSVVFNSSEGVGSS